MWGADVGADVGCRCNCRLWVQMWGAHAVVGCRCRCGCPGRDSCPGAGDAQQCSAQVPNPPSSSHHSIAPCPRCSWPQACARRSQRLARPWLHCWRTWKPSAPLPPWPRCCRCCTAAPTWTSPPCTARRSQVGARDQGSVLVSPQGWLGVTGAVVASCRHTDTPGHGGPG